MVYFRAKINSFLLSAFNFRTYSLENERVIGDRESVLSLEIHNVDLR